MQTAFQQGKDVREYVAAVYPFKSAPVLRVKATQSVEALFKLDDFAYETGDFTDALCEDL